MWVQYNGINLEVERVVQWSDRNIMSEDGSERLMRHVSLVVQCVVNPSATTVPNLNALSAPEIIVELKKRLLALRGSLIIQVRGRDLLRSPARAMKPGTPRQIDTDGSTIHYCDARGGPVPLYCDITSIHGVKTMLCTFAIETWLVDDIPIEGVSEQSALVSHRWTMSNSLDELYYSTRTIRGRMQFRADHLCEIDGTTGGLKYLANPSDYLADANHPLPSNYKRASVQTSLSSDGLTVDYTITDVEQERTLSADNPVARITGSYGSGLTWNDPIKPTSRYEQYSVTVHGRRGATYRQLVDAALKAIASYDNRAGLGPRMYWKNSVRASVDKKSVTVDIGYTVQGWVGLQVDVGMFALNWAGGNLQGDPLGVEDLQNGMGASIATATLGQQPLFGMLGGINDVAGGQQRLVPQQMNDGAIVPARTPSVSAAKSTQDDDVDDAQRARGEDQRPQE